MALQWLGDRVLAKTKAAALKGVNATMAEAVVIAKNNHPGWRNVTSKAEGSIQILEQAKQVGVGAQGMWGSRGVNYMIWLELNHGAALRNSASITYPRLASNIRKFRSAF